MRSNVTCPVTAIANSNPTSTLIPHLEVLPDKRPRRSTPDHPADRDTTALSSCAQLTIPADPLSKRTESDPKNRGSESTTCLHAFGRPKHSDRFLSSASQS